MGYLRFFNLVPGRGLINIRSPPDLFLELEKLTAVNAEGHRRDALSELIFDRINWISGI